MRVATSGSTTTIASSLRPPRRLHRLRSASRSKPSSSSSVSFASRSARKVFPEEEEDEDEDDQRPSTSFSPSSSSSESSSSDNTNTNANNSSRGGTRRRMVLGGSSLAAFAMMTTIDNGASFATEEEEEKVRVEEAIPKEKRRDIPLEKVARETFAFTFFYPTETLSGKPIPWSESRTRETYSSSEPMSPDARQRIVHELISFKGPLTTVVTVGELPPKLMNKPEKEWTAKNVANAILADKATGRVASGQKISLAEVDNAVKEEKEDGTTYYYYEYISQGSPNSKEGEATTYRHARGVTAVRDGFAYTVSMSTPERFWDEMDEGFNQSIRAFSLDAPGKKYRKPGDEGLDILHVFD